MERIPVCCSEIDPNWLNEVLTSEVRGGAAITGVTAEVIGEGVGFLGEVARLKLSYDRPGPTSVCSVIAKLPTANPGFKHIGTMFGLYRKEHGFYSDVAESVSMSVPRAYVNLADLDVEQYVLLLEDMAPRRPGNQIAGCSPTEAELALRELAVFHAGWWESPRLDEMGEWLPGPGDPFFDIVEGAYLQGLPRLISEFSHFLSDSVVALAQRVATSFKDSTDRGSGRRPHTFLHGDFRLDNMMFSRRGGMMEFTLLDWQLPYRANPMCDVVYFLVGNFDPAFRRANEDHLLRSYHDELVAAGVADYPFEQCVEDYRACGLSLLPYLVTIAGDLDLASLDERGLELMDMMFTRYGTGIDDLGSASFLD